MLNETKQICLVFLILDIISGSYHIYLPSSYEKTIIAAISL